MNTDATVELLIPVTNLVDDDQILTSSQDDEQPPIKQRSVVFDAKKSIDKTLRYTGRSYRSNLYKSGANSLKGPFFPETIVNWREDSIPNERHESELNPIEISSATSPLEVFEGTVQSVDREANVMHVILSPKVNRTGDHVAEISLQWVNQQDQDLVSSGAVFYLSLFRELDGATVRNTEELRFRRLPAWNGRQVERVWDEATKIANKFKTQKLAD